LSNPELRSDEAANANPFQGVSFAWGEVRHRRIRPAVHAFRYRAFFMRAPLEALERGHGNFVLGINRAALIGLHARDHGDGAGLREWLEGLLAQAGVNADGGIWLHAFPRVLGYTFKPVSFWFCHRADHALVAIIAEVNNTFGERHLYLLSRPDGAPLPQGVELVADKAFHVSPFCSVEGRYRFRFFNDEKRSLARIDHDDRDGPLLITSLSGRFVPASIATAWRTLLRYPLFTLGVIARIHWHALILWWRRVPFHTKPDPPQNPLTRGTP
jgi:DUF1365 family protein